MHQVSVKFPGMIVKGISYNEKEPAAKALLESCKGVKGRFDDIKLGEYMGFKTSLGYDSFNQQVNLLIRGELTYKIELGTDALGNITRINNALEKMPERLENIKTNLENVNKQIEAAKLELKNPFEHEKELSEMEERLAALDAELNVDNDGLEINNEIGNHDEESRDDEDIDQDYGGEKGNDEEYQEDGNIIPAKEKPSILDKIHNFDGNKKSADTEKHKKVEQAI